MLRSRAVKITTNPQLVSARWLLGLNNGGSDTMTIYLGDSTTAADTIWVCDEAKYATGNNQHFPFPINLDGGGGQLTVGGITDGYVYVSD